MKRLMIGQKNLYAGLMYIAAAFWFGLQSFGLGIGKVNEMGPGFFPLMVSVLLAIVGFATIFSSSDSQTVIGKTAWRSLIFILSGPLFFTFLVEGAGFLPAIWIAVYATTHASKQLRRRTALILASLFTLSAWIIFIKGLGMQIPVFGYWIMN